jgi:cytochrome P450
MLAPRRVMVVASIASLTMTPTALTAAAHPDPYGWYASLRARGPLVWLDAEGLWAATTAEAAQAVMTHPLARVRPAAEPVPAAIAGRPCGEIFERLVRMSDGAAHAALRPVVAGAAEGAEMARVRALAARWAQALTAISPAACQFDLSAHVMGAMLGFEDERLPGLAALMGDFVHGLAPQASPARLEAANAAAEALLTLFRARLRSPRSPGLLRALAARAGTARDVDERAVAANAIGFLSQAYEATAGLIGNSVKRLGEAPAMLADGGQAQAYVAEIARFDPPVHNTRRFFDDPAQIMSAGISAGQSVLVLLASANRDRALNPDPDAFRTDREDRRLFTFGFGPHGCPGQAIAETIAAEAVLRLAPIQATMGPMFTGAWRASVNTRAALLG